MELFLDMKNGSPPILAQEKRVNIKICVFNKDLTRIGVLSSVTLSWVQNVEDLHSLTEMKMKNGHSGENKERSSRMFRNTVCLIMTNEL